MLRFPKVFLGVAAAAAFALTAGAAQATPLEGSVPFGFSVTPTTGSTITNLKAFSSAHLSVENPGGLDSFAFLLPGDLGSLNGEGGAGSPFNFGITPTCPINTLCTLPAADVPIANFIDISHGANNMTFELQALQFERIPLLNEIIFSGTGTVCLTGSGCGGGLISFGVTKTGSSWSGSGTLSAIPEPPTLALLGAALLGLGFMRRRKKWMA